jgi:hypothetical protein
MKKFNSRSSILVGLGGAALMLAAIGCSSSSNGGTGGVGGTNAAGGSKGGAGGTSAAGGSKGGGAGTSAAGGGGGTSAAGGSGGSSAAGGGAGTSAVDGGDAGGTPALSYTFDSTLQGFQLQTYVDPGTYKNVGALAADAAIPANYPTVTVNTTEGSPSPGSLQIVATFTDYQQYVEVLIPLAALNLTGKTVNAQVQATTAFDGGAFIYVDSGGSYVFGGGSGVGLPAASWTSLSLDVDGVTTASFDPTDIVQLGIHIYSDPAPTDGGAFPSGSYTFLIDTVQAL